MKSPAFQFYPADFLADENVVLMTNQELGCYIKLMCYCWREGSIPSDVNKIAKLCGEDSSAMAELWLAISSCFTSASDDASRLVHPRLVSELKKQNEHKKERSESGKKGANARWNKDLACDSSAMAKPMAKPMANDGSSSSSSSSTSVINPPTPLGEFDGVDDQDGDAVDDGFDFFWKVYPRKVSKAAAQKAWAKLKLKSKPELRDAVMQGLAKAKESRQWTKDDGAFIPHASTWLNNRRWEDETDNMANANGGDPSMRDFLREQREMLASLGLPVGESLQ